MTEIDNQFRIGMNSWVVQDGNYPDFKAGNEYRFAVEFFPHDIRMVRTAPTQLSCRHIINSRYEIEGKIVFVAKSYWVIDVGVLIFQDAAPHPKAVVGGGLSGEIQLGIDPFFYFESLQHVEGMPNLFYDWQINQVLLETTPWIESTNPSGGKNLVRDATQESFVPVEETNAWEDDDGHAGYVFECELLERSAD
ncbi:MAG: hypothetical protein K0U72_03050 [Gammaproteobacteria bacterium]|nr:hypothetical protein [Gammaproteobacteria bacterium]